MEHTNESPDKAEEVRKWERWTRKKLVISAAALLISAASLIFSFSGIALPAGLDPGEWFQRSGAAVAVFCVYNQQVLTSITNHLLPSGGVFADGCRVSVWVKFRKYMPALERLNFGVMLFATLIWGYGDIMRKFVMTLVAS